MKWPFKIKALIIVSAFSQSMALVTVAMGYMKQPRLHFIVECTQVFQVTENGRELMKAKAVLPSRKRYTGSKVVRCKEADIRKWKERQYLLSMPYGYQSRIEPP